MYSNNIEYIKLAQTGNHNAMEQLVKNNTGLVWNIIKRFSGRGYELDDLYQIGAIGLIKAIKRFDTDLEVQLSTYAVPYILGEIKRFIRDDGIIKVSRQIKELNIKIKMLQQEHLSKYGKEITVGQLAQILEVSKEEIAAAIDSSVCVDSIDSCESNSEDKRTLIDKIVNTKDEYSTLVNSLDLKEALKDLDDRERKIILLRYFKEQTQSQVGKILGITQVQVSRIEKKVLEKMKRKMEAV